MDINALVVQLEKQGEDFLVDLLGIKEILQGKVSGYLKSVKETLGVLPSKEEFLQALNIYIYSKIDKDKVKQEIMSKLKWQYKIVSFLISSIVDKALPFLISYLVSQADNYLVNKVNKNWYENIKKAIETI